jgi:peptidoglycan hydrolase-like protein with peptidoglycan-binding domain
MRSGGVASPLPPTDGMLRLGSTGNAVKTLQRNLNTVMKSGLVVDGQFGQLTDAALRSFQSRYGLEVDGIYGPRSAAMMRAALAGKNRTDPAQTQSAHRHPDRGRHLRPGHLRRSAAGTQPSRRVVGCRWLDGSADHKGNATLPWCDRGRHRRPRSPSRRCNARSARPRTAYGDLTPPEGCKPSSTRARSNTEPST